MPANHQTSATEAVWFYDLRTNMPAFGKTNPLKPADFAGFEASFGPDPLGTATRENEGEAGRWRCFSRQQIAERGDNLDITWLREESDEAEDDLSTPEELATAITQHLQAALAEIEALTAELNGEDTVEVEA
jgi:type I restriction enzyme M protein